MLQVAIPMIARFTALDGIGPYEVLQRIPELNVTFVGHHRGEVRSENGMLGITVDATFDEMTRLGVYRLTRARRGGPFTRIDGDDALGDVPRVGRAGRDTHSAKGRRASRATDHHGGGRIEWHRHGVTARGTTGRSYRRGSCPIDDRVRPATTL